jgi:hypothetical protein
MWPKQTMSPRWALIDAIEKGLYHRHAPGNLALALVQIQ